MARRKRPDNETTEQTQTRRMLETVADSATRGEKVAWDRKMDKMVTLLAQLKPLEDQIIDLMAKKMPLIDDVAALRHDMIRECVHPYQMLIPHGEVIKCKFCDRQFSVPGASKPEKTRK
jgi:hypothetical protein